MAETGSRSGVRAIAIGCLLAGALVTCCAGANVAIFWQDEGREIQLCLAVKDFYDVNGRAPGSIAELPAPYSTWTSTADGASYDFACRSEGGVPSCTLSWMEDGLSHGRSCGRLDVREPTDYF